MYLPRSVKKTTDEQDRLLNKIVLANERLAFNAARFSCRRNDLRDAICGHIGIVPGSIIEQIDKDDIAIIKSNQANINELITGYYDALTDIAKRAKLYDDYNEVYIAAYDKLWYYTDRSISVIYFMYRHVLQWLWKYKASNKCIVVKSSLINRLKRELTHKRIELAHKLGKKPTQEELVDSLNWKPKWVGMIFNSSFNQVSFPEDIEGTLLSHTVDSEQHVLSKSMVELLSVIERDVVSYLANGKKLTGLCQKHGCTLRALYLALRRAKVKLRSAKHLCDAA